MKFHRHKNILITVSLYMVLKVTFMKSLVDFQRLSMKDTLTFKLKGLYGFLKVMD